MDAVVMAGGLGKRLGMGEKPCIELLGKPLITYVINALDKADRIGRIFTAVSPATPNTGIIVLNHYGGRIKVIRTPGGNYVGDMVYAVRTAGIVEPVLIHVPIYVCRSLGIRPDTVFNRDGKLIVPIGVNILDGQNIHKEQDDFNLILENPELALNINTVNELSRCKQLLEVA